MPKTDEEHLEELRAWRDNLVTALKTPETASAFGGMPDAPGGIGRMGGRSQLLSELKEVESKIAELEERVEDGPYLSTHQGVT